jgi:hypothetical protein
VAEVTRRVHTLRLSGLAALALVVCLAVTAPGVAAKKKKRGGKGVGVVDITKVVNAPVPDRAPGVNSPGPTLASTIEVGKQFKGR